MGYAKDRWIEMTQSGLDYGPVEDRYVCASCFDDRGLRNFVEQHAVAETCEFCGRHSDGDIAADLLDVVKFMNQCINKEYGDPADLLPYESAEGGYQGDTIYGDELLHEIGLFLPKDDSGKLWEAIVAGLGGRSGRLWCTRELPHDDDTSSWKLFCDHVKHHRRFFFLRGAHDPDLRILSPARLLRRIAKLCERYGLFKTIPAGSLSVVRVRRRKRGQQFTSALDLGPPREEEANMANRMSPAGVPMFYGSDSATTAILETFSGGGNYCVADFAVRRDVVLLDLTSVPPIPSIFERVPDEEYTGGPDDWDERWPLIFLNGFASDVSAPIDREEERAHTDYVPTQVVTEYFRSSFRWSGKPIDGIVYSSAKRPGHPSYVLFATQDDLVLEDAVIERLRKEDPFRFIGRAKPWIEMTAFKERRVNNTRHRKARGRSPAARRGLGTKAKRLTKSRPSKAR